MQSINQYASILQQLADPQLQQQMQNPTSGVPQYLILSEIQRRQQMRAEAATPSGPPPTTTVADDIMGQGVTGLPQMSEGAPAPEGGVASFAGGGPVSNDEKMRRMREQMEYVYGNYPQVVDIPMDAQDVDLGLGVVPNQPGYWTRVKQQVANSFKMPDSDKPFGETVGNAVSSGVKGMYKGSSLEKGLNAIDAEVGRSQRELYSVPGAVDQWAGDVQRYHYGNDKPKGQTIDLKLGDPPAVPPDLIPERPVLPGGPAKRKLTGAGSGGIAALGASKGIAVPTSSNEIPDYSQDIPRITDPEMRDAAAYMEMVRANSPDHSGDLIARQDQRLAENKKGRNDALAQGLMEAGLGIMAAGGKNGSFLGALGEGGIGGLKTYASQMAAVRDREDKIGQRREDLQLAQDAAKRGDFKTAAEIADRYNQRQLSLHGQNVQERRADIQHKTDMFKTKATLDKTDKEIASREKIANIQAGATLGAANVRASSGASSLGIAGLKQKDVLSMIKSEADALMRANPMPIGGDPVEYRRQMRAAAEQIVRDQIGGNIGQAQQSGKKRHVMGADGSFQ